MLWASTPTPASRTLTRTRSPSSRCGSDQQLPRPIVHVNHRVRGVAEQVQDDLLELDTVAGDVREIVGELRLKHDAVPLKLTQRQRDDLARGLVQIQPTRA